MTGIEDFQAAGGPKGCCSWSIGPIDRCGWMLDFVAMNRNAAFTHKNEWFFRTTDHEFMFAFNDMVFDRNGFPHNRP